MRLRLALLALAAAVLAPSAQAGEVTSGVVEPQVGAAGVTLGMSVEQWCSSSTG